MKKHVAVWLYGGIGTGNFSQGQPALELLLKRLSAEFSIVVYSQSLVNEDYPEQEFGVRCAPASVRNGILRWFLLMLYFRKDHRKVNYSSICSFCGFLAVVLGKIYHLPVSVNLGGGDSVGIQSIGYGVMLNPWFKKWALWSYRNATVLTVLTNFQKNLIERYGISRPIDVIPFGVDPGLHGEKKDDFPETETIHFLHVSNYHPVKDFEMLLKAFNLIRQKRKATLRVVGGDYDRLLRDEVIKELGIEGEIEFRGPVAHTRMSEHYSWADVLLHTSLFEGQGIVIAEAAMSNVLIAGTNVGLISDLGHRGAIVVPPRDYKMLANQTLQAIMQRETVRQKRNFAQAWAQEHDSFWTWNKFKSMISRMV
jgi:glycosyltransferase involved in cell wall biosynthesis